jgi:hypothetical protein
MPMPDTLMGVLGHRCASSSPQEVRTLDVTETAILHACMGHLVYQCQVDRFREACMPRLPVLLLGVTLAWLTACATIGVPSEAQVAFDHGLRLFQRG